MAKCRLPVKVLVLDVLKPHTPNIIELGTAMCGEISLSSVNITVYAVDEKTESVKMTLEGKDLNFENIEKTIEEAGAVVHSIDKVILGKVSSTEQVSVKSSTKAL